MTTKPEKTANWPENIYDQRSLWSEYGSEDFWPYGPPAFHEPVCLLMEQNGHGYCDCKASDSEDEEWGAN